MSFFQLTPAWLQFVLWTSLQASLLALVLLLFMPALAKFVPARWRLVLWLIVLARFAPIPLPASPYTVSHLWPEPAAAGANPSPAHAFIMPNSKSVLPPEILPEIAATPLELSPLEAHNAPVSTPIEPTASIALAGPAWPALLACAYLAGAGLILLRLMLATLALRRMIRRATAAEDRALRAVLREAQGALGIRRPLPLLLSDTISSPALVGLLRPRLLLPRILAAQLDPAELRHVLLHECAHHCRRDVLLNYVLAAVSIMHWFNPLVWIVLPRIRAERELATDERVLQHTDPAAYGHTLLKLFEATRLGPQTAPAVVGMLEHHRPQRHKSFFKRRIQMIAAFKHRSVWFAIPALMTLAALAALTLPPAQAAVQSQPQPHSHGHDVQQQHAGDHTPLLSEMHEMQHLFVQGTPHMETVGPEGARHTIEVSPAGRATHASVDAPAAVIVPTALDKNIAHIAFDQAALGDVLEYLRKEGGINMVVNWTALNTVGITRERQVSLVLKDVPLRKVLRLTLELAAGRAGVMNFTFDDGVLMVSSEAELGAMRKVHTVHSPKTATPLDVLGSTMESMMTKAVDLAAMAANQKLSIAEQKLADYEQRTRQAPDARGNSPFMIESDPTVQSLVQQRLALEQERAFIAKSGFSPAVAATKVMEMDSQLEVIDRQIKERREQLKQLAVQSTREANNNRAELKTEIYDVRSVVGVPANNTGALNADQRAAVEELAATVMKFVGREGSVSTFNGQLIISTTDDGQKRVHDILDELKKRQAEREDKARATPR